MASQIDTPTILKLHARMTKCAQKRGHPHPEDVAQDYVMRLLEGYHQTATVDQAYIDIIRLRSGRKGQPGYEAKIQAASLCTEKQMDAIQLIVDDPEELTIVDKLSLLKILEKVKRPRIRLALELHLEGLNNREIGIQLGVNESRVSQILKKALVELKLYGQSRTSRR